MKPRLKKTFFITLVIACVMFGFSFAIVPFYNAICRVTGLNTSYAISFQPTLNTHSIPDVTRSVVVQLISVNNETLPWDFYPLQTSVTIHPEENNTVYFYAKNKTTHTMVVQAIPSMTPPMAVSHFHKIECFCFRKQTLQPGESIKMPVVFRVDRALPDTVNTITLAYTLFDRTKGYYEPKT